MTIITFTGGGLAAALNATLYGVISTAQKKGYRILGGIEGWKSLLNDGKVIDLTDTNLDTLRLHGGTFLRSSRTNPFKEDNGIEQLKKRIEELDIDAIVAIGGDDTLGAAYGVSEQLDIPVIGLPKTVDNDLAGTYWTPGFPTTASKIISITKQAKEDAAYALKRVFLVETIGMKAGWIPAASCLADPDLIVVPEKEVKLDSLLEAIESKYKQNGEYATVVIAEEVRFDKDVSGVSDNQNDKFREKSRQNFISISLREKIKKELGIYAQCIIPRNYLQTGAPIKIDQEYAIKLGKYAVELLEKGESGKMCCISRPDELKKEFSVDSISLEKVTGKENHRVLDNSLFDFESFQVTEKMREYVSSFIEVDDVNQEYKNLQKQIIEI
ncbi:6-phosphofructokinase [Patescibacteria group bacterium]|nr:6-phosphofructokinase [Patescibacteria group bacterium]MBU1075215.1 6-phosphofructokinase [Patescibacteria group bacterium]